MIKHVVMWSLKDEAEGKSKEENRKIMQKKLQDLVGIVPGIEAFEVTIKGASSPADNYDVLLISEFATWDALQAYNAHPEHQKVVTFVRAVVNGRSAVDYEF